MPQGATAAQVRERYRALVREFHPDRYVEGSPGHAKALARMAEINAAHEVLTKDSARRVYERSEQVRRNGQARAAEAARAAGGSSAPTSDDDHATNANASRAADADFDYRRNATSEFDGVVDVAAPSSARTGPRPTPSTPPLVEHPEFFAAKLRGRRADGGASVDAASEGTGEASPDGVGSDVGRRTRQWFRRPR